MAEAALAQGFSARRFFSLFVGATVALLLRVARRQRSNKLHDSEPTGSWLSALLGDWPLTHLLAQRDRPLSLRVALLIASPGLVASRQQWTALHCAASEGHSACVAAALRARGDPNAADAQGHTALSMAVARGHGDVARCLLSARADAALEDHAGLTPLHLSAMRGDADMVGALLGAGAPLEAAHTVNGSTALLVACMGPKSASAALRLLEASAEANAARMGASTPLMLLAQWGETEAAVGMATALLRHGAQPGLADCFGQTALHLACRTGPPELVAALCAGGARPEAQDNDGTSPLQLLCQRCVDHPEDEALVDIAMAAILAAEPRAARLLDFSDATVLHTLCQYIGIRNASVPPLSALRAILAAGADPAVEEEGGWTAAHFLARSEAPAAAPALSALRAQGGHADFWESWDSSKPRLNSNAKYLARRGGHHRLDPAQRLDVLRGDLSLAAVAARLLEGRSSRVVALVGAGASTAAGIPDFRSPKGLWSQSETRELFSAAGFAAQPEAFWRQSANLFLGRRPTLVHKLLSALAARDMLVRVYTQNIDGLEAAAGVPEELIIQCHGSAQRALCSAEPRAHPVLSTADIAEAARAGGDGWRAPRCSVCKALMRPDIVFFGEALPDSYSKHSLEDLKGSDLLLVIGTALSVYPVAGLVKQVGPFVPRLLINRDRAGLWRDQNPENYRDVYWEGECDAGATELARLLGWDLEGDAGVAAVAASQA